MVSEKQRDLRRAKGKDMGLRMQGPKDCGEASELDCRWHGLGNTHY